MKAMKPTKLKMERLQRGLAQWVVSNELGMTPSRLSAFENGRERPLLETRVRLSKYYGIPLDELFPQEAQ